MSRKQELIKLFEFRIKALQLQEKYSSNPFSAVIFAMNAVQETMQVVKELRKPEPNFKKGLAQLHYGKQD